MERVTLRTKEGEGGEGIIQIYIRKLKVMPAVSCLVSVCDSWFRSPSLSLLRSSLLMVGSLTAGYHLQVAHVLVSDEYCTSLDEKDDLNIGAMNIYESTMYSLSLSISFDDSWHFRSRKEGVYSLLWHS